MPRSGTTHYAQRKSSVDHKSHNRPHKRRQCTGSERLEDVVERQWFMKGSSLAETDVLVAYECWDSLLLAFARPSVCKVRVERVEAGRRRRQARATRAVTA